MSANAAELTSSAQTPPPVPKRIVNAQTVCNERNEKNKLCNGHLKQLKTAGEASEVHLRGDDVLSKCHLCGTLYMGPPLGHLRDPDKQKRFVEAELSALLQAAGGTLPVIKKNEKGVYVIVEAEGSKHGHAAPAAAPAKPSAPAAQAATVAEKSIAPPASRAKGEPNRQLFRRSTYAGVVDTGPVAGETREQKIERLQKLVAGVKQKAEEGGGAEAQAETGAATAGPLSAPAASASPVAGAETPADLAPEQVEATTTPTSSTSHSWGEPDRTLMRRSNYAGVVDTGPVPGETHEQKIERLTKVVEGAKQKAEGG